MTAAAAVVRHRRIGMGLGAAGGAPGLGCRCVRRAMATRLRTVGRSRYAIGGVIERRGLPNRGGMAGGTLRRGGNVGRCRSRRPAVTGLDVTR